MVNRDGSVTEIEQQTGGPGALLHFKDYPTPEAASRTSGRRISFATQTQIFPWVGKPGYNLTTDLADEAIKYMQGLNAAAPDNHSSATMCPAAPMRRITRRRNGSRSLRASSTWAGTHYTREHLLRSVCRFAALPPNFPL
jgi:hypothetical protein